ncbi:hypothetical protein RHMOL_Rhmol03G0217500 [Rhododendron molle]|uniref:Uncharacterized protein n=1 Tax=Rhododendron molle TaxID=49168 RepID=A0ACC0PJA9_RHOML|nr:hypothetical protein RHMOL_Rhmol03G0217500 [Rhododendron molle]
MKMSGKAKEDRCTGLHKATPKSSKVTYRDVLLVPFKKIHKDLPRRVDRSRLRSESDASCTSLFDMQKILRTSLLSHESRVSRRGSSSAARGDSGNSSQVQVENGMFIHGDGTTETEAQNVIVIPAMKAIMVLVLNISGNFLEMDFWEVLLLQMCSNVQLEVPKAGRGSDSYTKEAQNSAESLNKERVEDKKPKGGTVTSKLDGFPISVAGDNTLHLGDKYQSAVTSSRGIKSGNLFEITQVDNTQVNQSYDDDWAEIVSILLKEQESELSAIPDIAPNLPTVESELSLVPDSNDSASEYCLPDEDNLISFDDLIVPQHFVSTSDESSSKDCMLPSNVKTEVSDKHLAQSVMHWDERSTVPGYYGVTSLENLHHNQHSQLSYPQFCLPQTNPGRPSFQGLYPHQAQMNCQKKFLDPKTTCGTSPLEPHFNARCRPTGSKAKSKKPDLFSCYSLLQQPTVFPHYQPNELYMAQVASLAQGLNRMEMRPSIYQQLSHDGFRLPNPDPSGGTGYSNQVSCNNFTKTNQEQSCHGRSKQLGQGYWWGH